MKELNPIMKHLAGRILAITNEKGGVGKTTYCQHICHALLEAGLTVAAIDLDPQHNFSDVMTGHVGITTNGTLDGYLSSSDLFSDVMPELPLYEVTAGFYLLATDLQLNDIETIPFESGVVTYPSYHIGELVKEYNIDVVVIDTPPVAGNRQLAGVLAATNVLLPMELTQFSINGIASVFDRLVDLCQKVDFPRPEFTLLPNRINTRAAKTAESLDGLTRLYGSVALPALAQRQPIADAADMGTPVWKLRDGNARIAATNMKKQLESMAQLVSLTQEKLV